jgi:beta-glucosidase
LFGAAWPQFDAADFEVIRTPIDFIGINYYKRAVVRADPAVFPDGACSVEQPGSVHTELGWESHPASLTRVLRWVRERYGDMPLYVTENGAAFYDPPSPVRGRVEDPLRVEYLRTHLLAVAEARRQGVDVRGYFVWSLLDNMEWAHGQTKRFGIVHVDYATQARTPKSSAAFYRDVIRSAGASLEPDAPRGPAVRAR